MPLPVRPFLITVALRDRAPAPDPGRWRTLAGLAEAAGVDAVVVDAGPADSVLVAAAVAAQTHRVGVIAVAPTTTTEPFLVSTSLATLDEVGRGRAGWLAAPVPADEARGLVTWPVPDDVWADAADHIDAVRALWDSWEDGAEIRDAATARFIDRRKVHHVDVRGEHFSVRGPSITPRPPQGHLPVFVWVHDVADLALARSSADVAITEDPDLALEGSGLVRLRSLPSGPTLAADVAAAEKAAFDGVLIQTDETSLAASALAPTLDALAPTLSARSAVEIAETKSLRERLGLPPATNRFASSV